MLLFFAFDFVSSETLFGLYVEDMLSQYWVVLAQFQLVRSVHRVLLGVVVAAATTFGHETYDFSLVAFFSH